MNVLAIFVALVAAKLIAEAWSARAPAAARVRANHRR